MKRDRSDQRHFSCSSCCCTHYGRRGFLGRLASLSGSALAVNMGILSASTERVFGAALVPDEAEKPSVRVAFLRPDVEKYTTGWPGAIYDIAASQRRYTEVLKGAAESLGLALDVTAEPLSTVEQGENFAAETLKKAPLGALMVVMGSVGWRVLQSFLDRREELPTLVFAPLGTHFTPVLRTLRPRSRLFVAATQHVEWLETAMEMFHALGRMKATRLAVVEGDEEKQHRLEPVGTVLHHMPAEYYAQLYHATADDPRAQQIAAAYANGAEQIVEPNEAEVVEAARTYLAIRRLMEEKGCHAVTMDCLGLLRGKYAHRTPPPCMAYMQLLNAGACAACERDVASALTIMLSSYLLRRPAFQHNGVANTVHNTYMGSHCTAPTKMDGFDVEDECAYILRDHHDAVGVAPQVLLREGQEATLMGFDNPGSLMAASGKIVANIEQPVGVGGCRTSFEMAVDGVADSRDIRGHHNQLVYGNHLNLLRAYCQFAGLESSHMAGGPM